MFSGLHESLNLDNLISDNPNSQEKIKGLKRKSKIFLNKISSIHRVLIHTYRAFFSFLKNLKVF